MNDDSVIDAEEVPLEETANLPVVFEPSSREPIERPGWVEKPPPSPRRDAELSRHPENQCVGHKKNGERCRKYAIRGSTVCRTHGGATKHVRDRARVRVQNASDRLVSKLIEFAFDDTKPPDTQLRAIRDALDRAGMQPTTQVEIGIAKPWETVFETIGGTPGDEFRTDPDAWDSAGLGANDVEDVEDVGVFSPPPKSDAAKQTRPDDQAGPRNAGLAGHSAAERDHGSGDQAPPPQGRPRERDRDRHDQPPSRHITGEAAMRVANRINQMNQYMPPPKAITSPHKGYRRP